MLRILYLSVILILSLLTALLSFLNKLSEPQYRSVRAGVFAIFGFFGFIPWAHAFLIQGSLVMNENTLRTSIICLLIMTLLYSLGAIFYISRIPERYFPGKCDYWVNIKLFKSIQNYF